MITTSLPIRVSATDPLDGQPRPFTLLRTDGPSVFLDYYPTNTAGVSILHFSDDLLNLRATNADLFEVAAGSVPISFDITSFVGGDRGFFAVTEFPGHTLADYEDPEPEGTETPRAYFIESLAPIDTLISGQPITVSFRLLDAATMQPISFSGSVRLGLVTIGGESVSFPYTLSSETLPLVAGVVNGSVTITSTDDRSSVRLAVIEILPAGSAFPPKKTAPGALATPPSPIDNLLGILGCLRKQPADYQDAGWNSSTVLQHPLLQTVARAGSYGEWRKSSSGNSAGRPHLGLDLLATPGTAVRPVRRGVVSYIGDLGALKGYVVVNHGNGYASRYLHVDPLVCENQVVETTTVIAKVASMSVAGPHLHLELLSPVPVDYWPTRNFVNFPVPGFDPGLFNASFSPPLIANGTNDSAAPAIKALFLWNRDPKTEECYYVNDIHTDPGANYVVTQLVDNESIYTLVPASVHFSTEDPSSQSLVERSSFSFDFEVSVYRLFQSTSTSFAEFGYVRRVGGVMAKPYQYQFWFKWDTSVYANEEKGPRRVHLEVADRLGKSTTAEWTFGPQITDPGSQSVDAEAPEGSTFEVTIRSLMGPFPAGMTGTPEDELTLAVESPAESSYDLLIEDPTGVVQPAATVKAVFTGHDAASEQTWRVRVKKKANAAIPTAAETITLKATSGVFPGIAHKMDVEVSADDFALIPAGPFAMGDAADNNLYGYAPVHTVIVSAFSMARTPTTKAQWDTVYA